MHSAGFNDKLSTPTTLQLVGKRFTLEGKAYARKLSCKVRALDYQITFRQLQFQVLNKLTFTSLFLIHVQLLFSCSCRIGASWRIFAFSADSQEITT